MKMSANDAHTHSQWEQTWIFYLELSALLPVTLKSTSVCICAHIHHQRHIIISSPSFFKTCWKCFFYQHLNGKKATSNSSSIVCTQRQMSTAYLTTLKQIDGSGLMITENILNDLRNIDDKNGRFFFCLYHVILQKSNLRTNDSIR